MNDRKKNALTWLRKSTLGVLTLFFLPLLGIAFFLLLGAQLAFLVQLPRLSQLIGNWQAMWLVFTTWPDFGFGLSFATAYYVNLTVSGFSRKTFSVAPFRERLQNMDRRHLVAAIGITIFALPVFVALGIEALVGTALTAFAITLGVLMLIWAASIGVPLIVISAISALSIGFFYNLMMPSNSNDHFTCRRDFVELRSGHRMPCEEIIVFWDKPLFLIEHAHDVLLVERQDLTFENLLEASKPAPISR
jgi:hypothetical protein